MLRQDAILFSLFPYEILLNIAITLDLRSVLRLARVSKKFKKISRDRDVWRQQHKQHFPAPQHSPHLMHINHTFCLEKDDPGYWLFIQKQFFSSIHTRKTFIRKFEYQNKNDLYKKLYVMLKSDDIDGFIALSKRESLEFLVNEKDRFGYTLIDHAVSANMLELLGAIYDRARQEEKSDKILFHWEIVCQKPISNKISFYNDKDKHIRLVNDYLIHSITKYRTLLLLKDTDLAQVLNQKNRVGERPLHVAVLKNQLQNVAHLLKQGADIDPVDNKNRRPIDYAVMYGFDDIVTLLLNYKPRLVANFWSTNVLHLAAMYNHVSILKKLIAENNFDEPNEVGYTPLMVAAAYNNFAAGDVLIANGYYIDFSDTFGTGSVITTAACGNTDFLHLLLMTGKLRKPVDNRHAKLFYAVSENSLESVREVLKQDALQINAKCEQTTVSMGSVLTQVAAAGSVEMATLLLDHGADVNSLDNENNTPLHFSVVHKKHSLTELFLERGAHLHYLNNMTHLPIHAAICQGNTVGLKILLRYGAYVDGECFAKAELLLPKKLKNKVIDVLLKNKIEEYISKRETTDIHRFFYSNPHKKVAAAKALLDVVRKSADQTSLDEYKDIIDKSIMLNNFYKIVIR